MSEKQYSREEAIDALIMAANSKAESASDDFVSETELLQVAKEMGVDTDRLREVLSQGTGTIQRKDSIHRGIGWPGNEEFVRTLRGELSDTEIQDIADALGTPMTEKPSVAGAAHSESWNGFLYRTTTVAKRDGRTKISVRIRPSFNRIMPLALVFIIVGLVPIANLASAKPTLPLLAGLAFALAAIWALMGASMRKSRTAIVKSLDETAELAKSEFVSRKSLNTMLHGSSPLELDEEPYRNTLQS